MLHLLSTLGLAAGIAATPVDSTELRREDLMTALRAGGYTILLRHARTDRSFNEDRTYVPAARADQRNLTEDGVRDAKLMGEVLRKFGIPIGEVLASPMFRTVETAQFAVGMPSLTMVLRTFPATTEQAALVAMAPKPGTNRVLVTHHFVIETHVPGIKPGDVDESEAAVVRPTGDGHVALIGRITLSDWRALAAAGGTAPRSPESTPNAPVPTGHGAVRAAAHGGATGATQPPVASEAAVIPDTPAGRLLQGYLRAFNSGKPEEMRAFIETSMVANPSRPTAVRLESYIELFEQHGPLMVATIEGSGSTQVIVGGRTKKAGFRMTLKLSEEVPGRVASVTFAFEGNS